MEQINGYTCECLYGGDGGRCSANENAHWNMSETRYQLKFGAAREASCPVDTCANGAQCMAAVQFRAASDEESFHESDWICQCDTAIGRFEGESETCVGGHARVFCTNQLAFSLLLYESLTEGP